jgi:hypothetical protein
MGIRTDGKAPASLRDLYRVASGDRTEFAALILKNFGMRTIFRNRSPHPHIKSYRRLVELQTTNVLPPKDILVSEENGFLRIAPDESAIVISFNDSDSA